jgi:hypothetical protein
MLNPKLYCTPSLDASVENYSLVELFSFDNPIEDNYSYAINFDSRLFILVQEEYLMVYFEEGVLTCDRVSNHAYTPTTVIGLGHIDGIESPSTLEEYNLLKPTCSGYKFVGWKIEGTNTSFAQNGVYTQLTGLTLVAEWEIDETSSDNWSDGH